MAPSRSIVIFGAGAVGCYLGAALLWADRPEGKVTLLARPSVAQAIQEHGLIVSERDGMERVVHPLAASSPEDVPPAELIILAVRSYDVAAAIPHVAALLDREGMVLGMQNGVGTEENLADALGRDRVLAGTLTSSVTMPEPGIVVRNNAGGGIALATMNGVAVPSWIAQGFEASNLPIQLVSDYRSLRWSKLLLNMLGAATSAILDLDMPELLSSPGLFRIEQLAFREATRVMDAGGIQTVALPGYPVPLVRLAMRLPGPLAQRLIGPRLIRSRGGSSPTMRRDLDRGKTEVGYLNGAVARTSRELGLRAPVNAALTDLTEELAAHPERRAEFRGKIDKLVQYVDRQAVGKGLRLDARE